jgi:hypothetical protein
MRRPQLAQGPQPFLIICVTDHNGIACGTVGTDTSFDYFDQLKDRRSSLSMHATLVEKGSAGFRFRWQSVKQTDGKEVANVSQDEFAPWGKEKKLSCEPGHTATAFYAPTTADQLDFQWGLTRR